MNVSLKKSSLPVALKKYAEQEGITEAEPPASRPVDPRDLFDIRFGSIVKKVKRDCLK